MLSLSAIAASLLPQWLEYFLAYCGALAFEGDPIEWAKNHTCETWLRGQHT
jgi:fatty-acid desaturase